MSELALVKFDLVCACYVLEFPHDVFVAGFGGEYCVE